MRLHQGIVDWDTATSNTLFLISFLYRYTFYSTSFIHHMHTYIIQIFMDDVCVQVIDVTDIIGTRLAGSGVALSFPKGGDIVKISEYRTSDSYAVSLGQSPRMLGQSGGMPSWKMFEFWESETVFPAF